jgi:hypothetical protein
VCCCGRRSVQGRGLIGSAEGSAGCAAASLRIKRSDDVDDQRSGDVRRSDERGVEWAVNLWNRKWQVERAPLFFRICQSRVASRLVPPITLIAKSPTWESAHLVTPSQSRPLIFTFPLRPSAADGDAFPWRSQCAAQRIGQDSPAAQSSSNARRSTGPMLVVRVIWSHPALGIGGATSSSRCRVVTAAVFRSFAVVADKLCMQGSRGCGAAGTGDPGAYGAAVPTLTT